VEYIEPFWRRDSTCRPIATCVALFATGYHATKEKSYIRFDHHAGCQDQVRNVTELGLSSTGRVRPIAAVRHDRHTINGTATLVQTADPQCVNRVEPVIGQLDPSLQTGVDHLRMPIRRIRSTGMPETETIDVVFGLHADAMGITREQFHGFVEGMTHRRRSTTVAEVAETAAFLASNRGSGFTGTVANLTGGLIVD
jgi:hypothetical protein